MKTRTKSFGDWLIEMAASILELVWLIVRAYLAFAVLSLALIGLLLLLDWLFGLGGGGSTTCVGFGGSVHEC